MLLLHDLEETQKNYKVGDIITENIPFVSSDNLTLDGYTLYSTALLKAGNEGNNDLKKRILKSVRRSKEHTKVKKQYSPSDMPMYREYGIVYYDDKISELEVFPWTFMTK